MNRYSMTLLIDSLNQNELRIKIISAGVIVYSKNYKNGHQTEFFVRSLEKFLKSNQLNKITRIAVVAGPAGFSSSRIAVAIANALAWSLNVSVGKLKVNIPEAQLLSELKGLTWEKRIEPFYSSAGV